MKTIKVSEATGPALNWLVAKAEGHEIDSLMGGAVWYWLKCSLTGELEVLEVFNPSTDWSQGGPIIERERISLLYHPDINCMSGEIFPRWIASTAAHKVEAPTPLIAAMRAFVASKLGDTVEVPDEL